jgi:hypothetical protein
MDPVEPNIHSFIVKVWQEVIVGEADEQGWRGYITHVPSGARRYFEDLAEILAFVQPTVAEEAVASTQPPCQQAPDPDVTEDAVPVATTASEAAARPEEVDMDSSSSGLDALQQQLSDGNKKVDSLANEAAQKQAELKQARDTQTALQHAIDQAKTSTSAIDKAAAAAVGPKATADKAHTDIAKSLADRLNDEQREAVTKVVKNADDRRKAAIEALSAAAKAVEAAQREADAAVEDSAAAAAELSAAHSALKGHGTSIQDVTVRVTALASSAKAAFDAGRLGAAYRLNEQLGSALGRLGDLTGPSHAATLQTKIVDAWTEVGSKAKAALKATEALATARSKLQDAEANVRAADSAHEATIDGGIAALEEQWGAKPSSPKATAEAAQMTPETGQSSDYNEATA